MFVLFKESPQWTSYFNIIFLMGEIVYYHKNHVIDFLKNVHGANNFLQKATLALSLSNVVIAQLRVGDAHSAKLTRR
jgi:hypothetical protein